MAMHRVIFQAALSIGLLAQAFQVGNIQVYTTEQAIIFLTPYHSHWPNLAFLTSLRTAGLKLMVKDAEESLDEKTTQPVDAASASTPITVQC
jgi:hypothetical protein